MRKQLMRTCGAKIKKILKKVTRVAKFYRLFQMPCIPEESPEEANDLDLESNCSSSPESEDSLVDPISVDDPILIEEDQDLDEAIRSILFMDATTAPNDLNDYTWLSKLEPISIDKKTGWMQYAIVP